MISSLPGNASRMLVDIARLAKRKPHDSKCIIEAESSKPDIKRRKNGKSEYDQEIPQSQTADNPIAPRGRAALPSRDTM